uniref:Hsr-omega protein n=1 Tax=Drosophila pseudoobscura pseudoobscura TaxID=46245 RepID=Q24619_DROPS|nr:hsr-omega [Drosophila pseudoobscura]
MEKCGKRVVNAKQRPYSSMATTPT